MPQAAAVLLEDRSPELFEPDTALPAQFQDLWARSARLSPGPRLALAVLQLAVVDVLKHRASRCAERRRVYRRARCWITSPDRTWPLSYLNVCESLRIAPDRLRSWVLEADASQRRVAVREVGKLLDTGRR